MLVLVWSGIAVVIAGGLFTFWLCNQKPDNIQLKPNLRGIRHRTALKWKTK